MCHRNASGKTNRNRTRSHQVTRYPPAGRRSRSHSSIALIGSALQHHTLQEALAKSTKTRDVKIVLATRQTERSRQIFWPVTRFILSWAEKELYIGDIYSTIAKLLVLTARPKRVIVLEDGGDSINSLDAVRQRLPITRHSESRPSVITNRYSKRLYKLHRQDRIRWVTCRSSAARDKQVILHSFESLKARSERRRIVYGDIVVGSSLATEGYLSELWYLDWLDRTLTPNSLFLPHRREDERFDKFARERGGTVIRTSESIESFAAKLLKVPAFHLLPTSPAFTLPLIVPAGTKLYVTPIPFLEWTHSASTILRQNIRDIEISASLS